VLGEAGSWASCHLKWLARPEAAASAGATSSSLQKQPAAASHSTGCAPHPGVPGGLVGRLALAGQVHV
jgi:hypothetical protein